MVSLLQSADIILNKCMGVKKGDKVLIVTDDLKKGLAKTFSVGGRMDCMRPRKFNGQEPPKSIAVAMKKADVVLLITSKSLTHTKATKNAKKTGARVASMPGITTDILQRAIDVDYIKMHKLNQKLANRIDKASRVKIKTKKGTDISFSIRGRKAKADSGIYTKKSFGGNLPAGEVFVAPVEGSANGVFIVDASMAGIGKIKKPLKISVTKGYGVDITGIHASKLKKIIYEHGKAALNIAEFGIGTNPKAAITGKVLEDEKVKGTVHLALGSNFSFGGKINVASHLDGVIRNPTVWLDGRKIMQNGKLLV